MGSVAFSAKPIVIFDPFRVSSPPLLWKRKPLEMKVVKHSDFTTGGEEVETRLGMPKGWGYTLYCPQGRWVVYCKERKKLFTMDDPRESNIYICSKKTTDVVIGKKLVKFYTITADWRYSIKAVQFTNISQVIKTLGLKKEQTVSVALNSATKGDWIVLDERLSPLPFLVKESDFKALFEPY